MKKQLILCLSAMLLGGVAVAGAQVRAASQPARLVSAPVGLMAPVWSPDGQYIAVTSDNYTGVMTVRADGSDLRVLTSAPGAGYGMAWSDDSRAVVGNVRNADRTRTLTQFGLDGRTTALAGASRNAQAPVMRTRAAKGLYTSMLQNPTEVAAATAALSQFAGRTVLNPVLSPDGSRIAFQVVGKGMWMINADGSALTALGAGSHPQWMPDGKNIVYTIVEDNGSAFTASTLMSMDVDNGRTATLVRNADCVPMTPAVSPDGTRVVFENAADAAIYVINLKK